MPVTRLTDEIKDRICHCFQQGVPQKDIAKYYNTSARSVYRVLVERGHIVPAAKLSETANAVMAVVNRYGMSPEQLARALQAPALTFDNVQAYLNRCSLDQLAQLFYSSALTKFGEAYLQAHEENSSTQNTRKVEESHAETA